MTVSQKDVFPEGKNQLWEPAFWESVFWETTLLGKRHSGKLSFWETDLLGKILLGKLPSGKLSFWETSYWEKTHWEKSSGSLPLGNFLTPIFLSFICELTPPCSAGSFLKKVYGHESYGHFSDATLNLNILEEQLVQLIELV